MKKVGEKFGGVGNWIYLCNRKKNKSLSRKNIKLAKTRELTQIIERVNSNDKSS